MSFISDTLSSAGDLTFRLITGGIKSPNLPHLLHAAPSLSGVAIISEIVGAQDPTPICQKLQKIIKSYRTGSSSQPKEVRTKENIASGVADLLSVLRKEGPVVNVSSLSGFLLAP